MSTWVAVLPALVSVALFGCATWRATGSWYRGDCTHVGTRVSTDSPRDWGLEIKVSTDAPWCAAVYPKAKP